MTYYLAVVHKDPGHCYGVSFPDVPGVVAAGDTLDTAIEDATDALAFAAEDWAELTGAPFPSPTNFETLWGREEIVAGHSRALIVAVPLRRDVREAA